MRFVAAFGVAVLVVLAMLLIGLRLSGFMRPDDTRMLDLHDVEVLGETQRRDLADVLGEDGVRAPPRFPLITDIPPAPPAAHDERAASGAEEVDR